MIGQNGTTVNGRSQVFVGTGVPARVSVRLGGAGPDRAVLSNLSAGRIDVTTGAGNDAVALFGVRADVIAVNAGNGNDLVTAADVVTRFGATVSGSLGFDTLHLGRVFGPASFQQFERTVRV